MNQLQILLLYFHFDGVWTKQNFSWVMSIINNKNNQNNHIHPFKHTFIHHRVVVVVVVVVVIIPLCDDTTA